VVLLSGWLLLAAGCLPDPQRLQLEQRLGQLAAARAGLQQSPPQTTSNCDEVADIKSHLAGEPGLYGEQPAWSELRAAVDALQAVCGQAVLVEQPAPESAVLTAARARWQQGIQRELGLACEHMRQAAAALGSAPPC
jgi:hypothetical protein